MLKNLSTLNIVSRKLKNELETKNEEKPVFKVNTLDRVWIVVERWCPDVKYDSESSYLSLLSYLTQMAICSHGFCVHRFNQVTVKIKSGKNAILLYVHRFSPLHFFLLFLYDSFMYMVFCPHVWCRPEESTRSQYEWL